MLRLQSDERLVALVRRGSSPAFEILVSRYESRLLAFCRHLLRSREDAEDVFQEVMAAAYKALLADDRPINVRPWLYRIARNRSLNHLRRTSAVGVDSMDIHLSEHGTSTADKAHQREDFRLLVGDIRELPETQRTALVLREMDALSYEQIAEAMETTVPSVKSLLVRARVSLAEAAEARLLTCDEVRDELGEVAEGLKRKPSPAVRRHLKACKRCDAFRVQLKETNRALAAILPLGPLVVLKKLALSQLGHHAGSGAAAAGSGATAAGSGAGVAGGTAAGSSIVAGSTAGGFSFVSAGLGAIASKAAVGFAAAAIVTAGAVEVDHSSRTVKHHATPIAAVTYRPHTIPAATRVAPAKRSLRYAPSAVIKRHVKAHKPAKAILVAAVTKVASKPVPTKTASAPTPPASPAATTPATTTTTPAPGRTSTETVPTVLTPPPPPLDLTPVVTTTTPAVTTTPPTTPPSSLAPPPSVTSPTPTPPAGTTPPPPTPPVGTAPTGTPPTGGSAGGGPATP